MATVVESHFPFLPAFLFPDLLLLLLLPILSFLLLSLFLILLRNRRPSVQLPPGPKPWPILGNILHVGSMPHVTFARLSQAHGPLISLRLGTQLIVVGSSPDAASEILKTHDHELSGRSVPHVSFALDPELNRDSIAWSTHCTDHWRSLRSMVRAELFTSKAVDQQSGIRERQAREMARFLDRRRGEEVRIRDVAFAYTFNGLASAYVSRDLIQLEGGGSERMSGIVREMMELYAAPNISDLYPSLGGLDLLGLRKRTEECVAKLRELWDPLISERREAKESSGRGSDRDFLDAMLDSGFADEAISYTFLTTVDQELLAAVSDTTSSSMEWALAELLKNPETMTAARREFDDKFSKGHVIKESDLAYLPYLCACVKETLRLHPPAPLLLPRRAATDCHVMGYTVPKAAHVFVNVWAIGRDPRYWEDALSFKPERFLVGGSERDVDYKGSHFEFLPFGSGRRICSGLPMAVRKVQLAVATLVHGFDWSLPAGMAAEELEMDERYGVTLMKLNPLVVIPTPRV
ncbi:unnamed protein product [Linum tenue]|uniref:Cytochrome P450 n=1 Tax=Linum tenue TaxID=586396 RepID=A0AAV0J4P9_9ROSI|nr:unnamed protein product [Linum tenue]